MAAGRAGRSADPVRELVKAQFTLTRAQAKALRLAALERQSSGEPGRADASAVLRDLIDEWMAKRRK
jgi:hypothetical protein